MKAGRLPRYNAAGVIAAAGAASAGEGAERLLLECLNFRLKRASRAVTLLYDRALKDLGMRSTQFSMLAGALASDGALMSELAAQLGMDRTTLTKNLAPLEERGWVEIRAGRDQRERRVYITAGGRQILKKATPIWRRAQAEALERLAAPPGFFDALLRVGSAGEPTDDDEGP